MITINESLWVSDKWKKSEVNTSWTVVFVWFSNLLLLKSRLRSILMCQNGWMNESSFEGLKSRLFTITKPRIYVQWIIMRRVFSIAADKVWLEIKTTSSS